MSDTKTKITDPSRILTVANMISLLRAFLALPIIYTLQYPDWRLWTFILILIAMISDMLDGFFLMTIRKCGTKFSFLTLS